jgi:hypothetical protein
MFSSMDCATIIDKYSTIFYSITQLPPPLPPPPSLLRKRLTPLMVAWTCSEEEAPKLETIKEPLIFCY